MSLLRESIQSGTEETLIVALANPAFWDRHELYCRAGNPSTRRVNVGLAAERLGLTEFNTWYVRGLARRLLEEGQQACQVNRAAPPRGTLDTCPLQDGQIVSLPDVYRGHRASCWPEPGDPEALTVPSGPGCHHPIRRMHVL